MAVVSLYGGPTGEREVCQQAVEQAEKLLAAVKAGEVIGFAVSRVHCDGLASFAVAGKCGGYGMLGALEMAKMVIVGINQDG